MIAIATPIIIGGTNDVEPAIAAEIRAKRPLACQHVPDEICGYYRTRLFMYRLDPDTICQLEFACAESGLFPSLCSTPQEQSWPKENLEFTRQT